MSLNSASAAAHRPLEDPLVYLPCSTILNLEPAQTIYRPGQPATGLYLIVEGKVKVGAMAENGREIVMDVYRTDDVFGESAFVESERSASAVTLEGTRLMMWTMEQIQDLGNRNPKLYFSLIQLMAKRVEQLQGRIESFAVDNVGRRLARALMHFSAKQDAVAVNGGAIQMAPLTHELLGQFIGTSREVVTLYMNHLRRQGSLSYSRKGILLRPERLNEWLTGTEAVEAPARKRVAEVPKTLTAGHSLHQ